MEVHAVGELLQRDRGHVVGGEHSRGAFRTAEDFEKGPVDAVDARAVGGRRPADPHRRAQAGCCHGLAVAVPARAVGLVFELGYREVCDAPVAGVNEVLRAHSAADFIVDRNHVTPLRTAADKDRRDLVLQGLLHGPGGARERQEDDARDSVLE